MKGRPDDPIEPMTLANCASSASGRHRVQRQCAALHVAQGAARREQMLANDHSDNKIQLKFQTKDFTGDVAEHIAVRVRIRNAAGHAGADRHGIDGACRAR
jgi:hypothetical protein